MLLILSLLLVPFLVYCVRASIGETRGFTKAIKISRIVFVSMVFLFSGLLAIERINYYLVGYRSTSIIYLITTIAGIVYVLSDRRFILNSFSRIMLNFIAVVFMMGSVFLALEMMDDFEKQIIYSDSKFRLEFTNRGPMSPCSLPSLFVKNGILERKGDLITPDTCVLGVNISEVNINESDTAYLVNYLLTDNLSGDETIQLSVRYNKP